MNNFHFPPSSSRSALLLKQYEQATSQLEHIKKQLQKKNLENQFYQDLEYVKTKYESIPHSYPVSNDKPQYKYQNLADQIMSNLLVDHRNPNIEIKNQANKFDNLNSRERENQYSKQSNNYNFPLVYPGQIPALQKLQHYEQRPTQQKQQSYEGLPIQQRQQSYEGPPIQQKQQSYEGPPIQQRQNNFIKQNNTQQNNAQQNKRQTEKEKLQNLFQADSNPFGAKNPPVKRSLETKQPKISLNDREYQKLKLQQGQGEIPLWKDQRDQWKEKNFPINLQQYQNPREKQKMKLQNQPSKMRDQQLIQRSASPAPVRANQGSVSKMAAFQNRYSNPFSKDEQSIRQKRQQQQREYRKALQEQKKNQEERKKQEKQMVREEKYSFHNYDPPVDPVNEKSDVQPKSTINPSKKLDPNGKPPVFNYQEIKKNSSSDLEFLKIKSNELRDNYKRGKLYYDQYIAQAKKLAQFYHIDYQQIIDQKIITEVQEKMAKKENEAKNEDKKQKNPAQNLGAKSEIKSQDKNADKDKETPLERINDSQSKQENPKNQSSLGFPNSQGPMSNYYQPPFYPQYLPNMMAQPHSNFYNPNLPIGGLQYHASSLNQLPSEDIDLMKMIFEEVKSMKKQFEKNIQKEKTQKLALQQAFVKLMAQNIQNPNPAGQPLNTQTLTYLSKMTKKSLNTLSEEFQISLTEPSDSSGDHSLSGVMDKIPFHNMSMLSIGRGGELQDNSIQQKIDEKQQKKKKTIQSQNQEKFSQNLENFFIKPYKIKKFQKFPLLVDANNSSVEIPNISNFMTLKNGQDIVNKLFEEDLLTMKKLQRQRQVQKLRNQVDNQFQYEPQKVSFKKKQNNYPDEQALHMNLENIQKNENARQKRKQKQVAATDNKYDEYENYSRKKQKTPKSKSYQNRLSHKRQGAESPLNAYQKPHEQSFPDFSDQSEINPISPHHHSPKLNFQILEQDEYQTAQKSSNRNGLQNEFYGDSVGKRSSPNKSGSKKHQMKNKNSANEQKHSEKKNHSKSKQKQKASIMNMINQNNIALKKYQSSPEMPNQYQRDYYQSSSRQSKPQKGDDLVGDFSNNHYQNSSGQNSYKPPPLVGNSNKLWDQSSQKIKDSASSPKQAISSPHISQTVESFEQSSNKIVKPPLSKKKSLRRKKESSLIKIKDSSTPSSSRIDQKTQDDLAKPQQFKFDSNVYQSEYEQTHNQKNLQKKIANLQEHSAKTPKQQIEINPPVIQLQKKSKKPSSPLKSQSLGGIKLKYLEQARNLAKQSKKKSNNSLQNDRHYEQKLSELESFISKKEDSTSREAIPQVNCNAQKSQSNKNIMNLLDQLQNQSYKDDFMSYRSQSEIN